MSDDATSQNEGAGCLMIIGTIIIGISIGHLYGDVYGWLSIGCALVFIGIAGQKR